MHTIEPIATIESCYTQRFGIPRQAGLVTSAEAYIVFEKNPNNELSLRGLEEFSHIWVIFIFHQHHYNRTKPLVQPPRLGGKTNIGVFATRSPNRPNGLGLSCVELKSVALTKGHIRLCITGGDFLNGTPVVDIKPYIPFADAISDANGSWAEPISDQLPVRWSDASIEKLQSLSEKQHLNFATTRRIIEDTISQDPRPAYERNKDGKHDQQWHMQIFSVDISFEVTAGTAIIVNCRSVESDQA